MSDISLALAWSSSHVFAQGNEPLEFWGFSVFLSVRLNVYFQSSTCGVLTGLLLVCSYCVVMADFGEASAALAPAAVFVVSDSESDLEPHPNVPPAVGHLTLISPEQSPGPTSNDSAVWAIFDKYCSCSNVCDRNGNVLIHPWDPEGTCPKKPTESVSFSRRDFYHSLGDFL